MCEDKYEENETETSCVVIFNCKNGNEDITNVHDYWLTHSTQVSFRSEYCNWLDINTTMFNDHSGLSKLKNAIKNIKIIGNASSDSEVLTYFPRDIKKMFPHAEELL